MGRIMWAAGCASALGSAIACGDSTDGSADHVEANLSATYAVTLTCNETTSYWSRGWKYDSVLGSSCDGTTSFSRASNARSYSSSASVQLSSKAPSEIVATVSTSASGMVSSKQLTAVAQPLGDGIASFIGKYADASGSNPLRAVDLVIRPADAVNSQAGTSSLTFTSDNTKLVSYGLYTKTCNYVRVKTTCNGSFATDFRVQSGGTTDAGAAADSSSGSDGALPPDASGVNDGAASPADAGGPDAQSDAGAQGDSGVDSGQSTQDAKCVADFYDVANISKAVAEVLGVTATCTSRNPARVAYGADYYYNGPLTCELSAEPSAQSAAAFSNDMETRSFYGFSIVTSSPSTSAVRGTTSTMLCSQY